MPQAIWKGHISFGLVNVPVSLFSAESSADLHFHLIDSRDAARVRYQRINAETGEEVPWDKIVKGYEFADGNYVLLSEKELEVAVGEPHRSIDIQEFVDLEDIPPKYFDRPYYLVPAKQGEKGYSLLRDAMADSGKVGIARVAIRTRQYLAALVADGHALTLNLLRFPQELKDPADLDVPTAKASDYRISPKEKKLATQLIAGMTADWKPQRYQDETRASLMALIEKKIEQGKTEAIEEPEEAEAEAEERGTINFIQALQKSVAKSAGRPARRRPGPSGKRPTRRKKKAG
jgi:DNA end-binding protein Ku